MKGQVLYSTARIQQFKNELNIRTDQNSQLLWMWAAPRSPLLPFSEQESPSPSCPQASHPMWSSRHHKQPQGDVTHLEMSHI